MTELKNITKSYGGKEVLKGLSLSFPEKGTVLIKGPSGCGKTTLVSIIAGLIPADSGEIKTDGEISMVFQDDRLIKSLSVSDNANLVIEDRKGQHDPAEILRKLGLGNELETKAESLSGGMARRCAIARALARKADIYIMDEPIRGLDQDTAERTLSVIREYTKGSLLIVVTHNEDDFPEPDMVVSLA